MNDLREIEAAVAAWDRQFDEDVAAGRLDEATQAKMKRLRKILEQLEILDDPAAFQRFVRSLDDLRHGRLVSQEDVENEFL